MTNVTPQPLGASVPAHLTRELAKRGAGSPTSDGVGQRLVAGWDDVDPFAAVVSAPACTPEQELLERTRAVGDRFPCPCGCGCEGVTSLSISQAAQSRWASKLRCAACVAAGHRASRDVPAAVPAESPAAATAAKVLTRRPIEEQDTAEVEMDRQAAAEVDRLNRARQVELWREAAPEKFRDARIDERLPREHAEAIKTRLRALRDGDPAGMLLIGPPGGGKTWLAWCLANMAVEHGLLRPGEIVAGRESDLLSQIAFAPFSEVNALRAKVFNPRVRMVLIDDFGRAPYPTPQARSALYDDLMDFCWSKNRTLVITANMTNDELKVLLGEASYDRLVAGVGGSSIVVEDRKMRARLAAEQRTAQQQRTGPVR